MGAREDAAHLLRRFSFGAASDEVVRLSALPRSKMVEAVLDFGDDAFPIAPTEFFIQENGDFQPNAGQVARWWALRLTLSTKPAHEKLTLFWHDHFAVSAAKVENGLLMLYYLDTLRTHAAGSFRALLGATTKDPAMMRWLDLDTSVKGKPNENYARELMELFTLGIGHYSEADVKEAARALTGWSLRTTFRADGRAARAPVVQSLRDGNRFVFSSYAEGLNDDGPKTILGKTDRFETESLLDMLVEHPQTAKYVCTKLWEFYAYPSPDKKVVERIAKVFAQSKGDIRQVLFAIANSSEFWTPRARRAIIKSPADFTVAFVRQLQRGRLIMAARGADAGPDKAIARPVRTIAEAILAAMSNQGMTLLYPPDVAGWDWGEAWVSPAKMLERLKFADILAARRGQNAGEALREKISAMAEPKTSEQVVALMIEAFDIPTTDAQRKVLEAALDKYGGVETLAKAETAARVLNPLLKVIFSMPEYQLS